MPVLKTNDGVSIHYRTYGSDSAAPLILLHGFTGSGAVFQRNVEALSKDHHVIVPDLRGHGDSDKPKAGYHVARLAVDLANLLEKLELKDRKIKAIGTSLGAAILWCYSELFTTDPFSHMVFVDQAPLQNRTADWDLDFCNRGMNNPLALSALQHTLATEPEVAHRGTIAACLGYRFDPIPGDPAAGSMEWIEDEVFFLGEALQGNAEWFGKLMADHTSLDWRDAIAKSFGPESGSDTKVLVVASSRSGCFPAAGPMKVVDLVNGSDNGSDGKTKATGVVLDWGGHWCYWEKPQLFNDLVLEFLM